MRIILASTSPRRTDLLKLARIDHTILAVTTDESYQVCESPTEYIVRMVHQKMQQAAALVSVSPALILTADTIGVLSDGQILTKPKDRDDAYAMWRKMSANTHEIWTAVLAQLWVNGDLLWQEQNLCQTQVEFVALNEAQMYAYWQTHEPKDKAGAYAIQGFGAAWVKKINGSYTNVVGLPLSETIQMINSAKHHLMHTSTCPKPS